MNRVLNNRRAEDRKGPRVYCPVGKQSGGYKRQSRELCSLISRSCSSKETAYAWGATESRAELHQGDEKGGKERLAGLRGKVQLRAG